MKKRIVPFLFLLLSFCVFFLYSAHSYAQSIHKDLSNSFFRLHILANSDTEEDQNLKYLVRDEIVSYMNTLCISNTSKEDAIELANSHLADFKQIAEKVVQENGYSYPVKVEVGNFTFPTKFYGNLALPAGSYDALRITIGKAEGQNWWCVLFPPLCFVNETTGIAEEETMEKIEENLTEDEMAFITTEDTQSVCFKFKLVEWMQNANSLWDTFQN